MAEQTETAASKAVPKKAAAKRKPVARKTAPKKVAPKKAAAKKTSKKSRKKSSPDFANRAQAAGRNAFLASLGFYGKAFDQAQDQFNTLQYQLEERRAKADKSYKDLVKRGTKVEKNAMGAIKEIEFPKFDLDSLTDRAKLEAQLDKAKARFEELKASVSFKTAA